MGSAHGAWERQLLAGQQELQMAAQPCAYFATVGARTNEEKPPKAFPIFLEVIPELPWLGKSSRSGEGQKTKHLSVFYQWEGGKRMRVESQGWNQPSAKSQPGVLHGFLNMTERGKPNTLNLATPESYSTNHSYSDAKPKLWWERDFP